MTTTLETVYPTSFGKFTNCDVATYRKLKKINHFYHQCAVPWMSRWERAQRRMEKNRKFRLRKVNYFCKDSWLFPEFWAKGTRSYRAWSDANGYHDITDAIAVPTPLLKRFQDDLYAAKHPVATAEDVTPLSLSSEEIDVLLGKAEAFALAQR